MCGGGAALLALDASPSEKQKNPSAVNLALIAVGEVEALALLDEFALRTSAFFPFSSPADNDLSDAQERSDENPRSRSHLRRERLCSEPHQSS